MTHVVAVQPRNTAQTARRNDLLSTSELVSLSSGLGIGEPDLVATWNWGADPTLDNIFAGVIVRSGSDDAIEAFVAAVRGGTRVPRGVTAVLSPRLPQELRRELAERDLAQGVSVISLAESACADPMMSGLRRHAAWRTMLSDLHDSVSRPMAHADELLAFGLLCSPDEAKAMIADLAGVGVPTADPRLDMLRLNAAL
jgi:hypothetical protein